jgi:uncharacterized protein (DUF1697 family)
VATTNSRWRTSAISSSSSATPTSPPPSRAATSSSLPTDTSDEPRLVRAIITAIHDRFAYDVPALVRTTNELAIVAQHHPYRDAQTDDAKLHVIFLAEAPPSEAIPTLDSAHFTPNEFTFEGCHL